MTLFLRQPRKYNIRRPCEADTMTRPAKSLEQENKKLNMRAEIKQKARKLCMLIVLLQTAYLTAQTTILWDNSNIGSSQGVIASTYWTGDDGKMIVADDFEANELWTIFKIHTKAGGQCGVSIPATKYGISIYTDDNNRPGNEIFTDKELLNTGTNGVMTLVLSTPFTLPATGTYWISIYAVFNINTPLPYTSARWNALRGNATIENEMCFYDPANISNDIQFMNWNATSTATYNQLKNISSMYFLIEGISSQTTNIIINTSSNAEHNIVSYYDLLGRNLYEKPVKGIYIIQNSNGTTKKIMR